MTTEPAPRYDEGVLLEKARKYSFRGRMDKATITGPIFERGHGSVVVDTNGREYLDFNSGQMCSALGHNHPEIVDAIKESCDTLIHASSSIFNVKEIELAEKLGELVPRPLQKSTFLGSGSDSNEAAITIAKKYTGGWEYAAPHVNFAGLGATARSVTFAGWHKGYGPTSVGAHAIMAPYCYRCPLGLTHPECRLACLWGSLEVLTLRPMARSQPSSPSRSSVPAGSSSRLRDGLRRSPRPVRNATSFSSSMRRRPGSASSAQCSPARRRVSCRIS